MDRAQEARRYIYMSHVVILLDASFVRHLVSFVSYFVFSHWCGCSLSVTESKMRFLLLLFALVVSSAAVLGDKQENLRAGRQLALGKLDVWPAGRDHNVEEVTLVQYGSNRQDDLRWEGDHYTGKGKGGYSKGSKGDDDGSSSSKGDSKGSKGDDDSGSSSSKGKGKGGLKGSKGDDDDDSGTRFR